MKTFALFFGCLLFYNFSICQEIASSVQEKLKNKHDLLCTDGRGGTLGCGQLMECRGMKVIFYHFQLDRSEKKLKIQGRIIDPSGRIIDSSGSNDTSGVFGFIFLARLQKNILKEIRPLRPSYNRTKSDSTEDKFPFREGDFQIEFKFTPLDRLYFNSVNFRAIEYNIGKLLSKK